MLSGNLSFDSETVDDEKSEGAQIDAPVSGPPKLSFPIPGSMEGVKSGSRAVVEKEYELQVFCGQGVPSEGLQRETEPQLTCRDLRPQRLRQEHPHDATLHRHEPHGG